MKKTLLFTALSAVIFCQSCLKSAKTDIDSDKRAVTRLSIINLLTPVTVFKNEVRERIKSSRESLKYSDQNSTEKDKSIKQFNSFMRELDTVKISVGIVDTLTVVDLKYLKSKLARISKNDASYYSGLGSWETLNNTNDQRLLDLTALPRDRGYRFLVKHMLDGPPFDLFRIGNIRISQAFLNDDQTKAYIYGEIFCGNLCGASYDMFFEKRNGKWVLKRRIMGWVS